MGFLAPWFLGGLLAIGLPIYLHLLQQHKVDPVKFPSLQFFERRTETSVRQRRLKYKVLLALRALMLLLLALLFANPYIRRHLAGAVETRHVLLVVDNSFSMHANNALERAKQDASAEVSRLSAGATVQVVALAGTASLLNQPTSDKAELQSAIQGIKPADGRSAFSEIARAVNAIAEARKLPVEAHVFSDFQRTSMPASFQELALPSGTSLIVHSLTSQPIPNFFVESVNAPSVISDPKKVRLTATIAGYGTPAGSQQVNLLINGKSVQSKSVNLPANGRATVEFIGPEVSYGWNRGEVRIDGRDALAGDDTFRFAIERADPRKVLFIHEPGRTRAALYVRSALEAAAENLFAIDTVSADQAASVSPSKYAFVVLSDLASVPASLEESLKKYIAGGGGVLISTGAATAARGTVPITGAKVKDTRYASRSTDRFFSPANLDLTHPAVSRADRWDGVRFYQAIAIEPGSAQVAAKLNDGTPLLLDSKMGEGRVVVFASTLDNVANDFPLHSSFVPFIEQTARYLAQVEMRPATVTVDSFVELRAAGAKAASAVEVLDPRGQRALDLKAASAAQNIRVVEEGYYEIGRQNGRRELVAVNADRAESNLEPIPAESLDLWKKTGDVPTGPGGTTESGEKPMSLWWYVALLLLIAMLIEAFVASRHLEPENA